MTRINQLTVLRNTAIIGVSSIVLSAVSLPAQAIELVTNGGFVPSNLSSASAYVGNGQVNIGWNVLTNTYGFLLSDGTIYSTNVDTANYGGFTAPSSAPVSFYGTAAVNSPTGSGWYLALDGAVPQTAQVSQTINGLTPGQNYTLTFYQASAQQKEFTGDTSSYFEVQFGSSTQNSATMFHLSTAPVSAWSQQTMSFTAQNSSQVLSFIAKGSPAGLPPFSLLSGVSVQDATPVPFETDALPIFGSTIAFGLGMWAKQKFAQKKFM